MVSFKKKDSLKKYGMWSAPFPPSGKCPDFFNEPFPLSILIEF